MSIKKIQETMSADDKIVAFDFQFLYFLYTLFKLKVNESAGFEFKEDVHIDHSNGDSTYIQVKHTVKDKPLTNKDVDLWKTIWSWINIINENNVDSILDGIQFIDRTNFILLTNKRDLDNKIIKKIQEYKNEKCTIENLIAEIEPLNNNKSEIDKKIEDILNQPKQLLSVFFMKISFSTEFDNIEKKILIDMEEKLFSEHLRQPILDMIYSRVRKKLADVVRTGQHLVYSQKDFSALVNSFDFHRQGKISLYEPLIDMSTTKPNSNMLFIRQLEDIEQIILNDNDSEEYVMDLLYDKLLYENNSIRWIQDSEVTEEEVYSVEQAAKSEWRKQFRRIYRNAKSAQLTEEEILDLARQLFETIEDTTVDFSMEVTSKKKLGNGLFLNLSDKPVIGWHKNWEEKYNGEKGLQ
ncbi:hypothetical protein G8C15_06880 [Enterococcus casseliflavus]|nr:hypothetical protein [Enterococcus casseliflavus]